MSQIARQPRVRRRLVLGVGLDAAALAHEGVGQTGDHCDHCAERDPLRQHSDAPLRRMSYRCSRPSLWDETTLFHSSTTRLTSRSASLRSLPLLSRPSLSRHSTYSSMLRTYLRT